jgi:hypothetical protein
VCSESHGAHLPSFLFMVWHRSSMTMISDFAEDWSLRFLREVYMVSQTLHASSVVWLDSITKEMCRQVIVQANHKKENGWLLLAFSAGRMIYMSRGLLAGWMSWVELLITLAAWCYSCQSKKHVMWRCSGALLASNDYGSIPWQGNWPQAEV